MTGYEILWPMVAHAVLVYMLYGLLGLRRRAMVRTGKAKPLQFRENRDEPAESLVVRNCIANQFEIPVLFHACCTALFVTEADNLAATVLAWVFVASRYAHAYVHVTSNDLRYRGPLFAFGFVALGGMWAWLATWIFFSGALWLR